MIKDDFEVDQRDLLPYTYPKLRDLKQLRYRSVCLGSYIPWDVKKQVKIIQDELGWEGDQVEGMPWDEYPYEKIECYMQGMRDYIKYLKRGYGRVSQMAALDLRTDASTKEHGRASDRRIRGQEATVAGNLSRLRRAFERSSTRSSAPPRCRHTSPIL